MDPILVTGGTGTLGRHVVRRLREAEHHVSVLTRRSDRSAEGVRFLTGDLLTGVGVEEAVAGARTIIHCAGGHKGDDVATQNLVRAASGADAERPHIVYISVVGVDRIPVHSAIDRMMFGYFEMKRKAEEVVAGSGLPWTTLRATQFHDLLFTVVRTLVKSPIVPTVSGVGFQPVDAGEVAARLALLAEGRPSGLLPPFAGPRAYGMAEVIRAYLRRAGMRRVLMPMWLPGEAARAFRSGANLAPLHASGKRTWESYLNDRLLHGKPE